MALHSTDNEASNQEKAKTKSNQDDKCMIDKLKTISNTTKSGSNNFASTGNRSFATFLSKIPKENHRNHFQENFREIDFTENEESSNDLQELITFNQEEDVVNEEKLEKISTSSLTNLQKSSINNSHRNFSNLLQLTNISSREDKKSPVESLNEHQKSTNNISNNVKHQDVLLLENNVCKHTTSNNEDDIKTLVSEMAAMSKIEKSLAAKMAKLHAIFSVANNKYTNDKNQNDDQEMMVESMHIEFNQLRGKLKTFERLLEEKLVVYQEDIVPWSKELMIKKTLETRNEPILQTQSHQAPNNQNIVSKKKTKKVWNSHTILIPRSITRITYN